MARRTLLELFETMPTEDQEIIMKRVSGVRRFDVAKELGLTYEQYRATERAAWQKLQDLMEQESCRSNLEVLVDEQNAKHGFTLTEIMVVVSLIGLLTLVAIPSISKMKESARRNEKLTKAMVLREAAYLAGIYDADRDAIVTEENADGWLRHGFESLDLDDQEATMPQWTATEFYFATPAEVATEMYEN